MTSPSPNLHLYAFFENDLEKVYVYAKKLLRMSEHITLVHEWGLL